MKVIKSGRAWTSTVKCKGCTSKLLIDNTDVRYYISDEDALAQHTQVDVKGTFCVDCPECGSEIKVANIPPLIEEQIKSRK